MSEQMAADIWIGGRIDTAVAAELCEVIGRQGLALDWADRPFRPKSAEDLVHAVKCNDDGISLLWLCDDTAAWGQFRELERFLEHHSIPFTRFSTGGSGFDPSKVEYRVDTGRQETTTDGSGNSVCPATRLLPIQVELSAVLGHCRSGATVPHVAAKLQTAVERLQQLMPRETPPLPPFEIRLVENAAGQDLSGKLDQQRSATATGSRDEIKDSADIPVEIRLPCFGMVVRLDRPSSTNNPGAGTITSDLTDPRDAEPDGWFQASVDAVESLVLAHACAGLDIGSPAYIEGIESAMEAVANRC